MSLGPFGHGQGYVAPGYVPPGVAPGYPINPPYVPSDSAPTAKAGIAQAQAQDGALKDLTQRPQPLVAPSGLLPAPTDEELKGALQLSTAALHLPGELLLLLRLPAGVEFDKDLQNQVHITSWAQSVTQQNIRVLLRPKRVVDNAVPLGPMQAPTQHPNVVAAPRVSVRDMASFMIQKLMKENHNVQCVISEPEQEAYFGQVSVSLPDIHPIAKIAKMRGMSCGHFANLFVVHIELIGMGDSINHTHPESCGSTNSDASIETKDPRPASMAMAMSTVESGTMAASADSVTSTAPMVESAVSAGSTTNGVKTPKDVFLNLMAAEDPLLKNWRDYYEVKIWPYLSMSFTDFMRDEEHKLEVARKQHEHELELARKEGPVSNG